MDYNSRPNSRDSFSNLVSSPNSIPNSSQNHFYHHNSSPQQNPSILSPNSSSIMSSSALMTPQMGFDPQMNQQMMNSSMTSSMSYPSFNSSDYYSNYNQYLQQYYREYYRQYWAQQQHNRQHLSSMSSHSVSSSAPQLKQPLKYGSRGSHSRAIFSQHNNQIMVLDNTSSSGGRSLRIYSLNDLFVDYLFPQQMFHLLLREDDNQLPFVEKESALQWIRCKQQLMTTTTTSTTTNSDLNFELKLILKIIQMLLKQNSRISGLDLSELLLDLIDFSVLNQNFLYFENDLKNSSLNEFRANLIRGQKTIALNFALSSGLMDHALTLAYLMEQIGKKTTKTTTTTTSDDLMIKTIRKFCDSLLPNDPISVFYSSVLNGILGKQNTFFELSFESFLILLSNELDLNCVSRVKQSDNFKHLLSFVKNLMDFKSKEEKEIVLSEELFDSEMDYLLVNECLQLSLNSRESCLSEVLLEAKERFVSLLFDFGFISNSLKYCQQLKRFERKSEKTKLLIKTIESRFQRIEEEFNDIKDNNLILEEEVKEEEELKQEFNEEKNEQIISEKPIESQFNNSLNLNENFYSGINPIMSSSNPQLIPQINPQINPQMIPQFNPEISAQNQQINQSQSSMAFNHFQPEVKEPEEELNPELSSNFVSFVSNSSSLPSIPSFESNSNKFFEENGFQEEIKSESKETKKSEENSLKPKTENNSSNNSGFLSKLLPFNAFKSKNQAILPDDSKMTLIFDKNTNQWIDTSLAKNNNNSGNQNQLPKPSSMPSMPPIFQTNSSNSGPIGAQKKFEFKSKKRYVDITRKS